MNIFIREDPGLDVGRVPRLNKHLFTIILLAPAIPLACGLFINNRPPNDLWWTIASTVYAFLRNRTDKFFPLTVTGQCLRYSLLFMCGLVLFNLTIVVFMSPIYSVLLLGNGVAIGLVLIMIAVLLTINRPINE